PRRAASSWPSKACLQGAACGASSAKGDLRVALFHGRAGLARGLIGRFWRFSRADITEPSAIGARAGVDGAIPSTIEKQVVALLTRQGKPSMTSRSSTKFLAASAVALALSQAGGAQAAQYELTFTGTNVSGD